MENRRGRAVEQLTAYGSFTLSSSIMLFPHLYEFAMLANAGLVLFNLRPLPLDGEILQYAGEAPAFEATDFAALGPSYGCLNVPLGPIPPAIPGAAFVLLGSLFTAAYERKNAVYILMRYLTQKKNEIRLKRVLSVHQLMATTETSIGEVIKKFQPPAYHIVWVMNLEGELLGIVGELEIINALFAEGMHTKVGTLVRNKI